MDVTRDPRLTDEGLKKRYAAETVRRPDKPYDCAYDVFGALTDYDREVAVFARNMWENDPVVTNERRRLLNDYGEIAELPTKETVMKEVLTIGRKVSHSVTDRLNAYKVYNEMMGYTGRGAGNQATVGIYANKVMLVKDHGSDEDWEAAARAQQKKLIQDAKDDAARNRLN